MKKLVSHKTASFTRILCYILFLILISLPFTNAMFTQPDDKIPETYNPQTLNRYAFEKNNPYRYTDPTGHIPVTSQMGTADEVYDYIVSVEEDKPELSANQVLSSGKYVS